MLKSDNPGFHATLRNQTREPTVLTGVGPKKIGNSADCRGMWSSGSSLYRTWFLLDFLVVSLDATLILPLDIMNVDDLLRCWSRWWLHVVTPVIAGDWSVFLEGMWMTIEILD